MSEPDLAALESIAGATRVQPRRDGFWIEAPGLDVQAMARAMNRLGYRLSTMTGLARADGETTVIYHYVTSGHTVNFKTSTDGGTLPSIASLVRAASWIEREIHDFFGTRFAGHPNLAPLLRPSQLKEGFFREPAASAAPAR